MDSSDAFNQMLPAGSKFECKGHVLKVYSLLAAGAFSEVYKVADVKSGELYAMKAEPKSIHRPSLILDAHVLTQLAGRIGFPRLLLCGQTALYSFVIMQMVGQNLAQLRCASPNERFTPATSLRIASQTLQRIQDLHNIGFLNRDVKASNFAIAYDSSIDSETIYMLDFGFARRFRDKNGVILPPRSAAAVLGTVLYTPLTSHEQQEQGRNDDLESWFYMVVEMFSGSLPWSDFYEIEKHRLTADMKLFSRGPGRAEFLKECPVEFDTILSLIDSFGYMQVPDYWKIHAEITRAFKRLGLNKQEPFDWQKDGSLLKRDESLDKAVKCCRASIKSH